MKKNSMSKQKTNGKKKNFEDPCAVSSDYGIDNNNFVVTTYVNLLNYLSITYTDYIFDILANFNINFCHRN